ncbi:MAG: HPr family phosphocarrier protein [Syntrophales bacterium]|jgi:phosphocarrier protein|nr:HPr family phosphocarrier protein [Syntrophales bacterium]
MKRTKAFTLKNKLGLHARAAAKIVGVSSRCESDVFIAKDGEKIDGKSILEILTLACPMESRITVEAEGPDADDVMRELKKLIEDKFGEE